jgi:hypothetical protein
LKLFVGVAALVINEEGSAYRQNYNHTTESVFSILPDKHCAFGALLKYHDDSAFKSHNLSWQAVDICHKGEDRFESFQKANDGGVSFQLHLQHLTNILESEQEMACNKPTLYNADVTCQAALR